MTDGRADRPRILVVDDDDSFREVLAATLEKEGYGVLKAGGGQEALDILERRGPVALVITDIKMPRMSGYELIKKARYAFPDMKILVVTAHGSIRGAVEAMRLGARNYVTKPFDRRELEAIVRETMAAGSADAVAGAGEHVFASEGMKAVLEAATRASGSSATVLLTGETGTGKEVVADLIHRGSGRKVLVKVNCSAIPENLLESELFGHRKGAFTGAGSDRTGRFVQAQGGTILLDEVGDLDRGLQAKLLRVLEDRRVEVVGGEPVAVDVRVLAATNRDPEESVRQGSMREDLFFRLNVIRIHVPPLRERRADIRPLAELFLRRAAGAGELSVDPDVLEAFEKYSWPGNVRELRNICERMTVMRRSDRLTAEDVPRHVKAGGRTPLKGGATIDLGDEGVSLHEIEKQIILEALEKNGWNQSKTARYLNVPRHVLLYRMEKYGIKGPAREK
jgi:DNA-binding NtrC family response regulator